MASDTIDPEVFGDLQDAMGAEFVEELVGTFLGEAPGMLGDLQSAFATGEPDQFRRAAHSIKSNANIFGAAALAELAREMEIEGLETDPDATGARLAALQAEYDRVAATLKDRQSG